MDVDGRSGFTGDAVAEVVCRGIADCKMMSLISCSLNIGIEELKTLI